MYLRPSRDLARLAKITSSPVLSFLDEIEHGTVHGIAKANDAQARGLGFVSIRAFGASYSAKQVDRHAHHVDMNARVGLAKVIVDEWFELRVEIAGTGVVMIVVLSLVYLRPYLSAGVVGLAFNYILVANAYLTNLVKGWSRLELSMVAPERVLEFCGLAAEDDATSTSLVVSDDWHLARGDISFQNVSFRYKPTTDLVLRNLSLEILAGEKIGIVGRTGAGKSSLTMAPFRLYPLASGASALTGATLRPPRCIRCAARSRASRKTPPLQGLTELVLGSV